jgi:hypothetical protein
MAAERNQQPPARGSLDGQLTLADWERDQARDTKHTRPAARSLADTETNSSLQANGARATASTAGATETSPRLLATAGALLTRSHLRELGLTRTMADAVFRSVPAVVVFPGSSRPAVHVEDYLALVEASTYAGDRVRPT